MSESETASSYDSYMQTLLDVLDRFRPKNVLEYGTGKSTGVLAMHPAVEHLTSVEHDSEYLRKVPVYENHTLLYRPNLDEYCRTRDEGLAYDLVFVDGRERARCLAFANRIIYPDGIIMLHDAKREKYQDAINKFKFKIWSDGGHTVCLTDNEQRAAELAALLSAGAVC